VSRFAHLERATLSATSAPSGTDLGAGLALRSLWSKPLRGPPVLCSATLRSCLRSAPLLFVRCARGPAFAPCSARPDRHGGLSPWERHAAC